MRVVMTSWGSYGDTYPYVGIGRLLRDRGHEVVLAVPEYYRELVESQGLRCHPIGPAIDPSERELVARIMDPIRGPRVLLREVLMPAVRTSFDELQAAVAGADVLVSHPITFAAPVVAHRTGIPWVSTVLSPLSFFSSSDPPALPVAPRLVHVMRALPFLGRWLHTLAHAATRSWSEPVYALRAELGLPRGRDPIHGGQFSPTLTLALFSRVLGSPQPDWPATTVQTGFVFYNGPETLNAELEAFLDAGSPPVVFTLGSSAVLTAGRFYDESAAAAHQLGVRAVLMTGGFPENHPRGALSPDILVIDRAPHQRLFPRAAAVVHQGGVGTTGQALLAGRPMLVVPHAHDQPDNAYRVGRLGVARTVFPKAYSRDRVARELEALLDLRYLAQAAEAAEVVRTEGGIDAAASAIEDVGRRRIEAVAAR